MMENSKCVGLRSLQNDLTCIAYKWHELGLQLDVEDNELENITGEGNRSQRCLFLTMQHWVRNSKEATKETLVETLKATVIGERRLADHIHKSNALSVDQLTSKDLKSLMQLLQPVSSKWYELGFQLDVDIGTLSSFQEFSRDVTQYLKQVLKLLMKKDPPLTIAHLIEALNSPLVGEKKLAKELKDKYDSKGLRYLFETDEDEYDDGN